MPSLGRFDPWIKALFLVLVAGFVWWGVHGRTGEIRDALRACSVPAALGALVLIVLGTFVTGFLWLAIMDAMGHRLPRRHGLSVFFVGQLGKYLPGSVWSFGVQAQLARRREVPVRTTLTVSAVFLGLNVASAACLGGLLGALSRHPAFPRWAFALLALGGALALVPALVRSLARRMAGREPAAGLRGSRWLCVLGLMLVTWLLYGGALWTLGPDRGGDAVVAVVAAYLLSYAAGVVVILAPAGLGAREATFVAVASPVVGFGTAAAVAVLSRVLFTVTDLVLAAGCWWRGRR